jgi:3-oxoacyl-[acyl-carrier protein] reductase
MVFDWNLPCYSRLPKGVKEMKKLENKVAIVTGASKGSAPRSPSIWPLREQRLLLTTPRAKRVPTASLLEIVRNRGKAIALQANVAKQAEIERLFAEAKKAFGRLDTEAAIYNA